MAIADSGDKCTSTGFASIRKYDITGMVATGHDAAGMPTALRTRAFREAVRNSYGDDRIDRVMLVDREGVIHITPAMRGIVTLADDVNAAKVRIVDPAGAQ